MGLITTLSDERSKTGKDLVVAEKMATGILTTATAAAAAASLAALAPLESAHTLQAMPSSSMGPLHATGPPEICLLTYHDTAFVGKEVTSSCTTEDTDAVGVEIAATCVNRAVGCADDVPFLVLGAADEWSVKRTANLSTALLQDVKRLTTSTTVPAFCRAAGKVTTARYSTWTKVAALLHASRVSSVEGCSAVGHIDADALQMATAPPLVEQAQVRAFLDDPAKAVFISREPAGGWARGSTKDDSGRNNLNNTLVNTGFVLVKPGAEGTEELLQRWYCGPEEPGLRGALGEPLSEYRTGFAHEQRVFEEVVLRDEALSARVQIAERVDEYNTPDGTNVRHFWFKADTEDADAAMRKASDVGLDLGANADCDALRLLREQQRGAQRGERGR